MKKRIPVLIYDEIKDSAIFVDNYTIHTHHESIEIKWFNGVPYRVRLQSFDN